MLKNGEISLPATHIWSKALSFVSGALSKVLYMSFVSWQTWEPTLRLRANPSHLCGKYVLGKLRQSLHLKFEQYCVLVFCETAVSVSFSGPATGTYRVRVGVSQRLPVRLQITDLGPSCYSVSVSAWMLPVGAGQWVRPPPPSTSHGEEIFGPDGSQHSHHSRSVRGNTSSISSREFRVLTRSISLECIVIIWVQEQ